VSEIGMVEPEKVVEQKALAIPDQAKAIKVTDKETMGKADEMQKNIAAMIKEIDGVFEPMAQKAFAAHREITGKWKTIKAPLEAADKTLKEGVKTYLRAERERAEAEERRLADIARKEEEERRRMEAQRLADERKAEEDRRIAEAEAAQKAGDEAKAAQIIEDAANAAEQAKAQETAIIAEPIYIAPVRVEQEVVKVDQRKYRTVWKAEVVDREALIIYIAEQLSKAAKTQSPAERSVYKEYAQALTPNDSWLNSKARSLGAQLVIPGVRVYEA
jgi:hypothetical protein